MNIRTEVRANRIDRLVSLSNRMLVNPIMNAIKSMIDDISIIGDSSYRLKAPCLPGVISPPNRVMSITMYGLMSKLWDASLVILMLIQGMNSEVRSIRAAINLKNHPLINMNPQQDRSVKAYKRIHG